MQKELLLLIVIVLTTSCKKTVLDKEFSCNSTTVNGVLERNEDVKKTFSIQIPMHWKTNLFFDELQSSIYFADTTKQLTETVILDITHVQKEYNFTTNFKKQLFKNDSVQQLKILKEKEFIFLEKPAYYRLSKGFKGKYPYQIVNIYIKQNSNSAFHVKTEVYGDSLINKRLCKAIQLIHTLELK
jgi:hypothetical protein